MSFNLGRADMRSKQGSTNDQYERKFQDSLRSNIRDFDGFDTKLEEQSRTRNRHSERSNGSPNNTKSWTVSDSTQDIPQRGRQGEKGKFQSLRAPYLVDEPENGPKKSQSPKYHGSDDGYFSAKEEGGSLSPRTTGNQGRQNGGKQKEQIYKKSPYFMEDVNRNTYKREGVAGTPRQQGQGQKQKLFEPKSLINDAGPQDSKGGKNTGYRASWETSRSMPPLGGGKARQGERPEDMGKGVPYHTDDSQLNTRYQEKTFIKGHQGRKIKWQDISDNSPYCYWDQNSKKQADVPKLSLTDVPELSNSREKEMAGNDRKNWNKNQSLSPREKPQLPFLDTCDRGTQTSIIAVEDDNDWIQDSYSDDIQGSKEQYNSQTSHQDRYSEGKVTSMFAPNNVFGARSEGIRA